MKNKGKVLLNTTQITKIMPNNNSDESKANFPNLWNLMADYVTVMQ
jgi:hypothetical protein